MYINLRTTPPFQKLQIASVNPKSIKFLLDSRKYIKKSKIKLENSQIPQTNNKILKDFPSKRDVCPLY